MGKYFVVVMVVIVCGCCFAGLPQLSNDYKIVWADEFNVDGAPDPNNWIYENGFVRNNEFQWYQPDNASCKGGMLIIEAKREPVKNPNYSPKGRDWRSKRWRSVKDEIPGNLRCRLCPRLAEKQLRNFGSLGGHCWTLRVPCWILDIF